MSDIFHLALPTVHYSTSITALATCPIAGLKVRNEIQKQAQDKQSVEIYDFILYILLPV